MASAFYNSGKVKMLDGSIDLDTDTIKVALVTGSYTPDPDTHDFFNDLTNEASGTGYSAGGFTLASKTLTQDNTNNRAVFDAADISVGTATFTFRYAVLYKSTGVAGTSALICYIDYGSEVSVVSSNFALNWNASGIFYI